MNLIRIKRNSRGAKANSWASSRVEALGVGCGKVGDL